MSIEVRQEAPTPDALGEHARISIAFVVDRILEVTLANDGLGGMSLTETPVADPRVKDYDAAEGEGPTRWAERFDISNWGLISACRDGARVGGAVIAFRAPDVRMLGGRDDVAVLWDIRVAPGQRGAGVGSALFQAAEGWAGARGAGARCKQIRLNRGAMHVPGGFPLAVTGRPRPCLRTCRWPLWRRFLGQAVTSCVPG